MLEGVGIVVFFGAKDGAGIMNSICSCIVLREGIVSFIKLGAWGEILGFVYGLVGVFE